VADRPVVNRGRSENVIFRQVSKAMPSKNRGRVASIFERYVSVIQRSCFAMFETTSAGNILFTYSDGLGQPERTPTEG